jgi:hypothetical protein
MHVLSLLVAAGTVAQLAFAAPHVQKQKRANKLKYVGVNESGPEFGDGKYPGKRPFSPTHLDPEKRLQSSESRNEKAVVLTVL